MWELLQIRALILGVYIGARLFVATIMCIYTVGFRAQGLGFLAHRISLFNARSI